MLLLLKLEKKYIFIGYFELNDFKITVFRTVTVIKKKKNINILHTILPEFKLISVVKFYQNI